MLLRSLITTHSKAVSDCWPTLRCGFLKPTVPKGSICTPPESVSSSMVLKPLYNQNLQHELGSERQSYCWCHQILKSPTPTSGGNERGWCQLTNWSPAVLNLSAVNQNIGEFNICLRIPWAGRSHEFCRFLGVGGEPFTFRASYG